MEVDGLGISASVLVIERSKPCTLHGEMNLIFGISEQKLNSATKTEV